MPRSSNTWDSYRTIIAWTALHVLVAVSAAMKYGLIILMGGILFLVFDWNKLRILYKRQKNSLFFEKWFYSLTVITFIFGIYMFIFKVAHIPIAILYGAILLVYVIKGSNYADKNRDIFFKS